MATDDLNCTKTTRAKDIMISEQTLRDAGVDAKIIVLISRNPTDQVLGIHIQSDKPQQGMNAYTRELLTAVLRLHLVKFKPSSVKGRTDRMVAIVHLNDAMLAFQDTQQSVTAGVLISGGYEFRLAEEDIRYKTMKRSDIGNPRLIS
jgi:hypothetical protein